MGNFHFPTKPGLLFITSSNHLAVIPNLHRVTVRTAWNKNLWRNSWLYSRNKDDKCSSYLERSSFSNTWLFWVTSGPAENTFQTVKPFFSHHGFLHFTFLQFWSSVRISHTTKCPAKIMPFPETLFCYSWNLNSLILWRRHITMADKVKPQLSM